MANRIRNERLEIKLTEEEKALFEEKRRKTTALFRKSLLYAYGGVDMRSKTSEISRLQVYNFTRFSWYSSHRFTFR